ncbi:helix-turn-helix transcriptional regulator [Marinobacter salinexigens]|uniref:helix-turn-helix transcriptional regulator n=1 Tax=Marinobacter salinexigens TaxID=2919747 RepID=UPI001CB75191|nr:hypothetical protein [Marinobacter salinexigens]
MVNDPALLQTLYSSLTDRQGFHGFLEQLTEAANGCAAQLVVIRKQPLRIDHLWHHGLSDEFLGWYLDNNMIAQDVVSNHAIHQPPGFFQSALALLPESNVDEDYDKWENDQDMLDSAWFVVHSTQSHCHVLTIQRTVSQGPYLAEELKALDRLVPFIRQAVQMYRQLSEQRLAASSLSAVIDVLPDATFILDDQALILHSNRAARSLVKKETCLKISDQRLSFGEKDVQDSFLRSSIQVVRSSHLADADYRTDLLILQRETRRPLLLAIRPIESSELLAGGALVTVYDPEQRALPSADLIAGYFNLSPMEAQLCADLVAGLSLKEVAALRHRSESTLRTYLKQVFAKTGYHRQGELVSGILSALLH